MPRRKQVAPMQRIDSGEVMQYPADSAEKRALYSKSNGHLNGSTKPNGRILPSGKKTYTPHRPAPSAPQSRTQLQSQPQGSILSLIICVGGIYASFLTWGLLQERITTTPYNTEPSTRMNKPNTGEAVEYFRYPIFVNTIQALFAFISGSLYLYSSTGRYSLIPSRAALPPLALVSLTTTLASPFGYASLAHVDYLTFVLAKSCKLLPVMALHITLFNKRYPLSKYLIVLAVTAGVAVFTLYHPPKPGKPSKTKSASTSSYYGLSLLGVNLLFDGLTNTIQDHIFKSPHRYGPVKGPQMMVSTNLLGFLLQTSWLLLTPLIPPTFNVPATATSDLTDAVAFITRHPAVLHDILGFCVAGAIGQLFIFATLECFSSLVLVTVTVTRKMLTMVLSVVWYGKRLTGMQWAGVALVFSGVAAEAWLSQAEKKAKAKEQLQRAKTKAG
ncbi:UDP-galactose transporter [Exophiala xenobiotica]|uniref:UDP-galactose transporter homolog 1 n=1 Tax=Lithohypha guttulata TaxID=1690604 RepID=A0ABR0K3J0_9EURO|nr:UDP-galactose transporter [Lithohypha guttulata]KAK5313302.1 UDP-galactose transporter [Exophiala xenobiotica]